MEEFDYYEIGRYLALGYALHWMPPLQKFPYGQWQKAPVPDRAMLEEQYWELASDYNSTALNLGVRTGKVSVGNGYGLLVVDVDLRSKEHTDECQAIVGSLLGDVSEYPYVTSGRGLGGHYHLACPVERLFYGPVASRFDEATKLYVVEVLSDNRQVVVPPSRHPDTGREYAWVDGMPDMLPEAPESLLRAPVVKTHVSTHAGHSCSVKGVEGRNNLLFSHAAQWLREGLDPAQLAECLYNLNCKIFDKPLDDEEVDGIVKSAIRRRP